MPQRFGSAFIGARVGKRTAPAQPGGHFFQKVLGSSVKRQQKRGPSVDLPRGAAGGRLSEARDRPRTARRLCCRYRAAGSRQFRRWPSPCGALAVTLGFSARWRPHFAMPEGGSNSFRSASPSSRVRVVGLAPPGAGLYTARLVKGMAPMPFTRRSVRLVGQVVHQLAEAGCLGLAPSPSHSTQHWVGRALPGPCRTPSFADPPTSVSDDASVGCEACGVAASSTEAQLSGAVALRTLRAAWCVERGSLQGVCPGQVEDARQSARGIAC